MIFYVRAIPKVTTDYSLQYALAKAVVSIYSMKCHSKGSTLPPHKKGCHLITDTVVKECADGLKGVAVGILVLNCLHTSCGLTVNENCDP